MPTLANKRIILTGGATGIGAATALKVATEGAKLASFDVNDEGGEATVRHIVDSGGEARYWHVDVSKESDVQAAVDEAVDWLGGSVNVLLNVAGVLQGANVGVDEFPEETWDFVIDINLKGAFFMAKHVGRHMIPARSGTMVFVASGAGVVGGSSSFAYGSSKGGVHGLSLVLESRLEQAGIRVNDVLPGALDTPLKRAQVEHTRTVTGDEDAYKRAISRLASPDGVAEVLAFLASDAANYVRGSIRTI